MTHALFQDYFSPRKEKIYFKDLNRKVTIRFSIEEFLRLQKIAYTKGQRTAPFIRQLLRAYLAHLPDSV